MLALRPGAASLHEVVVGNCRFGLLVLAVRMTNVDGNRSTAAAWPRELSLVCISSTSFLCRLNDISVTSSEQESFPCRSARACRSLRRDSPFPLRSCPKSSTSRRCAR